VAAVFLLSLGVAVLAARSLRIKLAQSGIVGRDMNKPDRPEVPEMGGLAIVAGFGAGVLVALGAASFLGLLPEADPVLLLASLCTVLLAGLIGIVDDLAGLRQGVKALLPVIAALPLAAVRAGQTAMHIPLIGRIEFGFFYPLVLIPAGVTGAANAVNMLAGFNGLEAGMGLVAAASLAVIAGSLGEVTALVILLAAAGALAGVLIYNWYPARIFVGDVGTLSIGAVLAAACVVGNFEAAGAVVIIPYAFDFVIKAANRLPSRDWWGEYNRADGKLYCRNLRPVGLCQWIIKLSGGISERNLVLTLLAVEAAFGLLAILLYARLFF
jgi:UDP-N-acetylglucosamine--dolichyl-phosphate N-acetylglucosaminephosphotransferase